MIASSLPERPSCWPKPISKVQATEEAEPHVQEHPREARWRSGPRGEAGWYLEQEREAARPDPGGRGRGQRHPPLSPRSHRMGDMTCMPERLEALEMIGAYAQFLGFDPGTAGASISRSSCRCRRWPPKFAIPPIRGRCRAPRSWPSGACRSFRRSSCAACPVVPAASSPAWRLPFCCLPAPATADAGCRRAQDKPLRQADAGLAAPAAAWRRPHAHRLHRAPTPPTSGWARSPCRAQETQTASAPRPARTISRHRPRRHLLADRAERAAGGGRCQDARRHGVRKRHGHHQRRPRIRHRQW